MIGKTILHYKILEKHSATLDVSPYDFATIYAGLGDKEKALEFLQRGLEQRGGGSVFSKLTHSGIPCVMTQDLLIW